MIVLVGVDASGNLDTLLGAGGVLLAAVGYASGPMIFKRHLADLDPRATMGASLAVAAVVLLPVALLDAPTRTPSAGALGAVVVLGLVCTALAFSLMAVLINEIGPARAVVITYINPIIAVALGVTILGERLGAGAVAGLLLILAGSWLSTDGRLPRDSPRYSRAGERSSRFDKHGRRFDDRGGLVSGLQIELVGGFTGDQGDDAVGPARHLDLGHEDVLLDFEDRSGQAVARAPERARAAREDRLREVLSGHASARSSPLHTTRQLLTSRLGRVVT